MDGHDLMPDEDGAQARETENDVILLADKEKGQDALFPSLGTVHPALFLYRQEKGQDALFPEMGVAATIMDNLQAADVVAGLNRGLGTDEGEWLTQLGYGLAHVVGIAFDTRHGLRQKSAVDV